MGEFAQVGDLLAPSLEKSGQPVKRGTMAHDHDIYMQLADVAAQRRDPAALQKYVPRLEELAIRDSHRLYHAIAHRAWGVLHRLTERYAEAEGQLNLALEIFDQLDTRWQCGLTHFELGELEKARFVSHSAREHFTRALDRFETMRAAPDAMRARIALEKLS